MIVDDDKAINTEKHNIIIQTERLSLRNIVNDDKVAERNGMEGKDEVFIWDYTHLVYMICNPDFQ